MNLRPILIAFGILLLVGLCAVGFWALRHGLTPSSTLPNGAKFVLQEAMVGPYTNIEPKGNFVMQATRWLPPAVRRWIGPGAAATRSGGRSYYTYALHDHALHLWFSVFSNNVPVNPDRLDRDFFLADERGWLYSSDGWSDRGSGHYPQSELVCHSFGAFPRWQSSFQVVSIPTEEDKRHLQLTIPNPQISSQPATNWLTRPVPQEVQAAGTVFRLASMEPREYVPYEFRSFADTPYHGPPRWNLAVESRDPDGTTNAWHLLRERYRDNFLNVSLYGLPPRTSASDDFDDLQWQIELVLCADERSAIASNVFLEFPAAKLPEPGEAVTWPLTNAILPAVHLIGAGQAVFTNGLLAETGIPDSPGSSTSTSTRGNGDEEVETKTVKRRHPFLVFANQDALTNTYLSCRILDLTDNKVQWLRRYGRLSEEPVFDAYYSSSLPEWELESLDTNRLYQFVIGIHPIREVSFFIDAPIHQPPGK